MAVKISALATLGVAIQAAAVFPVVQSGVTSKVPLSAIVGGSNTQVQYNNNGVFAGAAGITVVNSGNSFAFGSTPATTIGVTRFTHGMVLAASRNQAGSQDVPLARFGVFVNDMLYFGSTSSDAGKVAGMRYGIHTGGSFIWEINGATLLDAFAASVRLPQGVSLVGARQGGGSDIFIATVASDNANYFGATDSAATYIRSGAGIGFRLQGTTDGYSMSTVGITKSNAADAAALVFELRAAGSTASNNNGGKLQLSGGRRAGTGNYGAVSLRMNQDDSTFWNMVELVHFANARRVLALCRSTDLTTTEMPTSTGDYVMYVGNAVSVPAADGVSGHIYYSDGAKPAWRYAGNNLRLDGSAATASAGGGTLPATPVAFLTATLNGTTIKIPYYAN